MTNINFNTVGVALSFQVKLLKHMSASNHVRVKDYLCAGFDTFPPKEIKNHPCAGVIKDAEEFLRKHGWKCGLYDWGPEKGIQYTCVSPNDEWYRSHYTY